MRTRTLTILMMIFTLLGAPLAQAGPHDRGHGHHDRGHGHHDRGHHGKQHKKHHKQQRHHERRRHEARRHHQWRRGDHLPRHYYSDSRYWVKGLAPSSPLQAAARASLAEHRWALCAGRGGGWRDHGHHSQSLIPAACSYVSKSARPKTRASSEALSRAFRSRFDMARLPTHVRPGQHSQA